MAATPVASRFATATSPCSGSSVVSITRHRWSAGCTTCWMPRMIRPAYGWETMPLATTPIRYDRFDRRCCAARLGTKSISAAAASTRRRVSSATTTSRRSFRTNETVGCDTPARRATSLMVTRLGPSGERFDISAS